MFQVCCNHILCKHMYSDESHLYTKKKHRSTLCVTTVTLISSPLWGVNSHPQLTPKRKWFKGQFPESVWTLWPYCVYRPYWFLVRTLISHGSFLACCLEEPQDWRQSGWLLTNSLSHSLTVSPRNLQLLLKLVPNDFKWAHKDGIFGNPKGAFR